MKLTKKQKNILLLAGGAGLVLFLISKAKATTPDDNSGTNTGTSTPGIVTDLSADYQIQPSDSYTPL